MNKKPIDVEKDTEIERVQKILKQFYPAEPKGIDTQPLHQLLIQALLDTREAARRAARVAALEEAAGAVCIYCKQGEKPEFKLRYYHADFDGIPLGVCKADAIHNLIAAEQGQDERKVGDGE